jgi:SAM-dependent methyltransferase
MALDEEKFIQDFYQNYYCDVFSKGDSLSSLSYRLTHKVMESKISKKHFSSVLEIGAGKAEHYSFINHSFDKYTMLDKVYDESYTKFNDPRITWITSDILNFGKELHMQNLFDRIIMTCVLHHVENPYRVLLVIRKLLKSGGLFTLFLPSDPGVLNRLVRKLLVTPNALKFGFREYPLVNAFEHRNHYWALKTLIKKTFEADEISVKYFPLNIKAGNLSLFSVWNITKK